MTDDSESQDTKEIVAEVIEYLDENDLLVKDGSENGNEDDRDVRDAIEQLTELQERTVDQLEREENDDENTDTPPTGRGFY